MKDVRAICVVCKRQTEQQLCVHCIMSDFYESLKEKVRVARAEQGRASSRVEQTVSSSKIFTFTALQHSEECLRTNVCAAMARINHKRCLLKNKKEKLACLRRRRKEYELSFRHLQNGLEHWEHAIRTKEERLRKKQAVLETRKETLKKSRISLAWEEITTIFPLGLVSSEELRSGDAAIVDEITEATMTTFKNGRWVFSTTDSHYFKITSSRVPDYSDYRDLKEWLYRKKQTKHLVSPDASTLHTLAALAGASHLLSVLHLIYDVFLPFPTSLGKFLTLEKVTEAKMDTMILQLNANAGFLCFSQGLDDVHLSLSRPFCNLFTLSQNLAISGSTHPFQVPLPFLSEFSSQAERVEWTECDWEDTPGSLRGEPDWEEVSQETPHWAETPHSSAITTLITSATSSVTHLFRTA